MAEELSMLIKDQVYEHSKLWTRIQNTLADLAFLNLGFARARKEDNDFGLNINADAMLEMNTLFQDDLRDAAELFDRIEQSSEQISADPDFRWAIEQLPQRRALAKIYNTCALEVRTAYEGVRQRPISLEAAEAFEDSTRNSILNARFTDETTLG